MSSVVEAEHRKFNHGNNYWWDPNGPLASLHQFNHARMSFLTKHFTKNINGLRILDVGCGGGILSLTLARMGALVTGIDISSKSIQAAQQQACTSVYGSGHADFHCVTIEEWISKKPTDVFDIVIVSEVLEHVANFRKFLSDAAMCVKRPAQDSKNELTLGGTLYVTTINKNILSRVAMIDIAENLLGLLPQKTHTYEKFIRPSDIEYAVKEANMYIVDQCGFVPLPCLFPRPRLSIFPTSLFTGVNYGIIARAMIQRKA